LLLEHVLPLEVLPLEEAGALPALAGTPPDDAPLAGATTEVGCVAGAAAAGVVVPPGAKTCGREMEGKVPLMVGMLMVGMVGMLMEGIVTL